MGTKGTWHRPTSISEAEASLRWAILREKDPDKKETLKAELDYMLERERYWNDYEKQQGDYKHESFTGGPEVERVRNTKAKGLLGRIRRTWQLFRRSPRSGC